MAGSTSAMAPPTSTLPVIRYATEKATVKCTAAELIVLFIAPLLSPRLFTGYGVNYRVCEMIDKIVYYDHRDWQYL